ncbi:hypothetical protein BT96DRAFT_995254 [Gymnopus androsaceus JB14]|uniref:Uncharacterized protein n=1 Tax=Gymnopus androsaceus JB14 TaxID=1447944 RepID=A0A6A4HH95_9AGAR|nr:hypothetical protein BT96DRAFT_995254 [Gymnopus androsaceus JB14]
MGKKVFVNKREKWLLEQLPFYSAKNPGPDWDAYLGDVICRYLKRFPASLLLNKEPSDKDLEKVNDEEPDFEKPLPPGPYKEAVRQRNKEWVKEEMLAKHTPGLKMTPDVVIRACLTGVGVVKPRRSAAHILWAKDHKEEVDNYCKAGNSTDPSSIASLSEPTTAIPTASSSLPNPNGPSISSADSNVGHMELKVSSLTTGNSLAMIADTKKNKKNRRKKKQGEGSKGEVEQDKSKKSNQVAANFQIAAAELFERLSKDKKGLWEDLVEVDFETWMSEYVSMLTGPAPTTPEDHQAIRALPQLAQKILDLIHVYTGMYCGFWAGGPELIYSGKPTVLSASAGTSPGTVGMTFGRACRTEWKEIMVPIIGKFLRRCYSIEECCLRALKAEEGMTDQVLATEDNDKDSLQADSLDGWDEVAGTAMAPDVVCSEPVDPMSMDFNVAPAGTAMAPNVACSEPADPMCMDFNVVPPPCLSPPAYAPAMAVATPLVPSHGNVFRVPDTTRPKACQPQWAVTTTAHSAITPTVPQAPALTYPTSPLSSAVPPPTPHVAQVTAAPALTSPAHPPSSPVSPPTPHVVQVSATTPLAVPPMLPTMSPLLSGTPVETTESKKRKVGPTMARRKGKKMRAADLETNKGGGASDSVLEVEPDKAALRELPTVPEGAPAWVGSMLTLCGVVGAADQK